MVAENTLYSIQMSAAQMGMSLSFPLLDMLSSLSGYALWVLFASLWQLAVSLFYLARYQCCLAYYYETAKSTSGLDPNAPATPDGL